MARFPTKPYQGSSNKSTINDKVFFNEHALFADLNGNGLSPAETFIIGIKPSSSLFDLNNFTFSYNPVLAMSGDECESNLFISGITFSENGGFAKKIEVFDSSNKLVYKGSTKTPTFEIKIWNLKVKNKLAPPGLYTINTILGSNQYNAKDVNLQYRVFVGCNVQEVCG